MKVLKSGIIEMQNTLRTTVNDSLDRISYLDNFEIDHHRLDKKVKTFIKNCKIDDLVK